MRFALLLLMLAGCGYGIRGEIGPGWDVDDGLSAAGQISAPIPIRSFIDGMHAGVAVSLWGRANGETQVGGIGLGMDFGITPGGLNPPQGAIPRSGFGAGLQMMPRYGSGGFEGALAFNLKHGKGVAGDWHELTVNDGDDARSNTVSWYDWVFTTLGGTAQVVFDGGEQPVRQLDLLFFGEWLRL